MEEASVKRMEGLIKASLQQGSLFRLQEDIRFVPENNVSDNREEAVQLLVANGVFTAHDLFLLSAVNSLGNATAPMILRKLELEKRRTPQLDIPLYSGTRDLKRALKSLVQYGLLYSFAYNAVQAEKESRVVVYSCTMIGWRLFRTKLMVNIPFDRLAVYRSTSDILRRLAANSVAFSFAGNSMCNGVILNENLPYGDESKQKRIQIYARTSLENLAIKRRYIIEPAYFRVEPELITEEQNQKLIDDRITQLQELVEYYVEKEGWDVRLVFTVEDLEGLNRLLALLKRREMDFFMKYAIFTSENVIAENNYQLDTSFLKMTVSQGRNRMSLDQDCILE